MISKRLTKLVTFFFAYLIFNLPQVFAHLDSTNQIVKTCVAMQIKTETPIIDGRLNDLIWKKVMSSIGFHQRAPHQGKAATEKTSFQVVYNNKALYFAIICHDQAVEKIRTRLGRRDSHLKSDRVSIHLDTYHSHHTSYEFSVYALGVKRDAVYTEDSGADDRTWDAVWDVETEINERGWQAEFRIPFHAVRFNQSEKHT